MGGNRYPTNSTLLPSSDTVAVVVSSSGVSTGFGNLGGGEKKHVFVEGKDVPLRASMHGTLFFSVFLLS